MDLISGQTMEYPWGSTHAIAELMGIEPGEKKMAEVWYGAHRLASSAISGQGSLATQIEKYPAQYLGSDVVERFGMRLPYLMKLIAPDEPLSLQVHPNKKRAEKMFAREEAKGIALTSPYRRYKDDNHKPELIYALTDFQAIAGFRAPRRAVEILTGIDHPLVSRIRALLRTGAGAFGINLAVKYLLNPKTTPSGKQVDSAVALFTKRLAEGFSPSTRVDQIVSSLGQAYPGDVGALVAALMNPVHLRPGEVLFTPAGGIHAYLKGLGVEVMAASDNVLRAGFTKKYIDARELLRCLDYVAGPPVRIAPEIVSDNTQVFYAPVEDFELSVSTLSGAKVGIPGKGARIILCVKGEIFLCDTNGKELYLCPGQAAFVCASDGPIYAYGKGLIMQADTP